MSRSNIAPESPEQASSGYSNISTSGKGKGVKLKQPVCKSSLRCSVDGDSDRFGGDPGTNYYSSPQQIAQSNLAGLQTIRDVPECDLYGSYLESSSSSPDSPFDLREFLANIEEKPVFHPPEAYKRNSMLAVVRPWDPPKFDSQIHENHRRHRPWEESTHSSLAMMVSDRSRNKKPRKRTEAKKENDRRRWVNHIERRKNQGPDDNKPHSSKTITPVENPTSLLDLVRESSPDPGPNFYPRPLIKSETWNHHPPALLEEQRRKRNGYHDDQDIEYYSQTDRVNLNRHKSRTMPVP